MILLIRFIFVFQKNQNKFSCGSPHGPFWSVKHLNFGQKLPTRTAYHTFQESRHAEITKNLYYVLSPEGSQKNSISSWSTVFNETMLNIFRNYAPNKYIICDDRDPVWMNENMKSKIKSKTHKQYT